MVSNQIQLAAVWLLFRRVDPGDGRENGRSWGDAFEADGMGSEGGIQCDDTFLGGGRSGTLVDSGWGPQADSTMAVFVLVLLEEPPAVSASVLDRAEALRKVGSVFQCFVLRLGVRIVVRDVRAAVRLYATSR